MTNIAPWAVEKMQTSACSQMWFETWSAIFLVLVSADVSARGDCITWLHAGPRSDHAASAAGCAVAVLEVALLYSMLACKHTDRVL